MSSGPSLTCIIPTQGRETLTRTLDSIMPQMQPRDRVIVVLDMFEATPEDIERLFMMVKPYGEQVIRAAAGDGHHCYGHCQLNFGISQAKPGSWLTFNDDDDVYTPGAWDAIRGEIGLLESPRPILFRFQSWYGPIYWQERGRVQENTIGGHCLVTPKLKGKVGRFGCRYQGDYDMIASTLELWAPVEPHWSDSIIARTRPG